MNENNYKSVKVDDFIKIIEGENIGYTHPLRGNVRHMEDEDLRLKRQIGIEPERFIRFPSRDERDKSRHRHNVIGSGVPREQWPDFDKPIVHVVENFIIWDRGISTGRDLKPELTLGIDLYSCHFKGFWTLRDIRSKASLILDNCKFVSSLNAKDQAQSLNFIDSNFKTIKIHGLSSVDGEQTFALPSLSFYDTICDELQLINCHIKLLMIEGEKSAIKSLLIHNCVIEKMVFRNGDYESFAISDMNSGSSIEFSGKARVFSLSNEPKIKLEGESIDKIEGEAVEKQESKPILLESITLKFSVQDVKGEFLINNLNTASLSISGISNSNILIKICQINSLDIKGFTNIGQLQLHDITQLNALTINNSSLDKAQFIEVDIIAARTVSVVTSNVSDIWLFNADFPKHTMSRTASDYRGKRNVFRQLKLAAGKQGNRIQELGYEALEMDSYEKDNHSEKTYIDQAILVTNRWSNNHGQDWSRAMFWLILLSWIGFSTIKYCQGYRLAFQSPDFVQIAQYVEFTLNPLHTYKNLFETETTSPSLEGLARITDVLCKLLSGYLIFQFLRAFRKFVK